MKPKDTLKPELAEIVGGSNSHRDSVIAFDTMDVILLDSQSSAPVGSHVGSQRSSFSSAGTVIAPQSIAAIPLDTGHAFRDDLGHGLQVDTRGATEFYRVDDDSYRPFTIYGGSGDGKVKITTLPASTTGSLSSIITTSIASSEPDRGDHRSGGGGGTGCSGSLADETSDGGPLEQKCVVGSGSIVGANGTGTDDGGAGDGGTGREHGHGTGILQEKWWYMTLQIAIPFFVAGVGTIGAGIILGHVEANLGNMSGRREIFHMILGNIALVQVQATVASFIVSMFAVAVGAIINGTIIFDHVMLLTASAMFTATSSCFVLDFVLVAVILISSRTSMNPDNLATPLAASIGDVVSISLLAGMATLLFENIDTHLWVTFVMVAVYVFLLPFWMLLVYRNKYTRSVLSTGWVPVLSALFISGMGGLVLDKAVGIFNGFVVFQPIINGIGGNLVSVQASKISTMLHQSSIIGIIPPHAKIFELPWKALFHGVPYARTARILIAMSIPGQVLFIFVADYIHMSRSTIGVPFVLSYLFVSTLQIMLLLYIAHVIIHLMWKWKIDPDNSAIPYLTALGDLFGSSFLMLAFLFLRSIGHPYGEKSTETVDGFGLLSTPEMTTISGGTLTGLIHDGSGI
uniref:SLC41A/MgtE integral membrane domain-containing protein n=1 Tax=Anopheles stephensi TaxID=30069 RepID=A0A182YQH0_ANOST